LKLTWPFDEVDLALPISEEALKVAKAKLAPDHPITLRIMRILAGAYFFARKVDLALSLSEETVRAQKVKLGARPSRHA